MIITKNSNPMRVRLVPVDNHIKVGLIEFAKLGLQYLFLSNGSAILAILANQTFFINKCKYRVVALLGLYLLGSCMALIATWCSYMSHRNLTEGKNLRDEKEHTWFSCAVGTCIASFVFFVLGCIVALMSFF